MPRLWLAATGKARLRSFQVKYCVTETANLLECYKLDGGENFENNVSTYLGLEISGKPKNDEGGAYVEYTIYYGSKFEKLSNDNAEDEEKRVYCLIAKLYSDGFATKVININSDSVIFETQKYQSRFDIQGGLV